VSVPVAEEIRPKAKQVEGTNALLGPLRSFLWRAADRFGVGRPCDADSLRIDRRRMPLRGLGREFDGTVIAHLSDLHYGPFVRARHLHRYVERINALEPDFVVVTGDFITLGQQREAERVAEVLRDLQPNVASVACLGNHDYGIWHPKVRRRRVDLADRLAGGLREAGMWVLRNETRRFSCGQSALQFVGVEDCWTGHCSPRRALRHVLPNTPTIALVHNPDLAPRLATAGAQWVLAGHTHGKARYNTRLSKWVYPTRFKRFVAGEYPLAGGARLYVSRGLTNPWGFALEPRPEVTLFTLCPTVTRQEAPRRARGPSATNAYDPGDRLYNDLGGR